MPLQERTSKRLSPPIRAAGAIPLALVMALLLIALTGCARGSYPVDFFSEMHYQRSYKIQEPPSLSAPSDSVPVTGREVTLTLAQARLIQNPLTKDASTQQRGAKLFQVNCAVCHGATGLGDGPMQDRLKVAGYGGTPADLTASGPTRAKPDGEVFFTISKGFAGAYGLPRERFLMPPFEKLLTAEQRWALVHYIRSLQQ